ncbi:MAG: Citrate synthase [Methanomassiliicoccales archaeon PtaU1.Bin124]|nr:MAG: Citrate synthase [Methanomassiliicoccales archaeon PtaU1.Bin124]
MNEGAPKTVVRGLKDVAAAETRISFVNPMGSLYYMGYNIDDLVGRIIYAEIAFLFIHKRLPKQKELNKFSKALVAEMKLPDAVVDSIKATPRDCHPMDVLRTEVSHLGEYDPDGGEFSEAANNRRAIRLMAQVPTIVATLHRSREGKETPSPREDFGFATNFLYMFRGSPPDMDETEVLHRLMILHADHGFNASTFAARVTASTNSDMYSAVTTAIGTLKGPIHGGASEKVMNMLNDIEVEERVDEYISGLLDDHKKIMGFGHRVYRVEDPRTKHLRGIVENLCHRPRTSSLYNRCLLIEQIVHDRKKIYPNLDFYAAVAMDALEIPKEYFTPFFASSRISGWVAHIIEQYEDAVLLRPSSDYVGEYGKKFIPIGER